MRKVLYPALVLVICLTLFAAGAVCYVQTYAAIDNTVSYTDGQSFTNPVANGADPFVYKDVDGTYYMYTTNSGGNGYIAYTSRDLVN